MSSELVLSLAEVCEMTSGEWINDPFTAVVSKITPKIGKPPKSQKFWVCTLSDTTGSASVEMAVFTAPKFKEGDQIEVGGQGNKFEDDPQWGKKIKTGMKTEIHVLGHSAHHEEQQERKATSQPSVSGEAFSVAGVTVGMSINNALTLLTSKLTHDEMIERVITPSFWASVHEVASDIIRLSRLLEAGKLSEPIRVRTGETAQNKPVAPPARNVAPANRQPSKPTDEQLANQDPNAGEEDVPF